MKSRSPNSCAPGARSRGFSLIETVIALGIMGLAVTALLGLLPHGIEMSKKAASAGARSRVVDTVQSALANYSFSGFGKLSFPVRMNFDEEGELLDNNNAAALVALVAEISCPPLNGGSGGRPVIMPNGGTTEPNLYNFVVKVASTPLADFDFEKSSPLSYSTVPLHIARVIR